MSATGTPNNNCNDHPIQLDFLKIVIWVQVRKKLISLYFIEKYKVYII